jgi:hypothetical protein
MLPPKFVDIVVQSGQHVYSFTRNAGNRTKKFELLPARIQRSSTACAIKDCGWIDPIDRQ